MLAVRGKESGVGFQKFIGVNGGKQFFAEVFITAVVKIDPQKSDGASVVVFDEHSGCPQDAPVLCGHLIVVQKIVGFVGIGSQHLQSGVGGRAAYSPVADMAVCNGNDFAGFGCDIMEHDLVIRAKGFPKEVYEKRVLVKSG